MRVGERIAERRRAIGWSQSRLAREAGISQPTIGKLEAGISSGSSHLHRIARVLKTTPAYLSWETDDPEEGAPPPERGLGIQLIPMPVAMPSGPALMRMFQALLLPVPAGASRDEIARRLAETLPTGLARLQGERQRQVPAPADDDEWPSIAPDAAAPARRRARRT
jgi:transcriptional regulator with XRE-family HTH domain